VVPQARVAPRGLSARQRRWMISSSAFLMLGGVIAARVRKMSRGRR
jgi:hypothetical protein